jgi:hypothetical protein
MTAQGVRVQLNGEESVRRKAAEFQEVPGEAEADAVRSTFLQRAETKVAPGQLGTALTSMGSSAREQIVERLQRERGNAFVQRVVASAQRSEEPEGTTGRMVGLSQPDMVGEVQRRKGGGSALPDGTRGEMEGHFGADLSGVRIHSDGTAAALSRELNAQAFTTGKDVFFGEGKYNPTSTDGRATLAHELTHVGQQGGFGAPVGTAAQREGADDEEVQALSVQREGEDEEVQALSVQREGEDEELQALSVQREGEDEEVQALSVQRQPAADEEERSA